MARRRHPKHEVEDVIRYAEAIGWTVKAGGGGHVWGTLLCPRSSRDGCRVFVNSTPQNEGNHARRIRARSIAATTATRSPVVCHDFTLIARGSSLSADELVERLYEAGRGDVTASLQRGLIVLDFDREAPSFEEAVQGAVAGVKRAGAVVEHVEPDHLVSLADIAKRAGLTRSAVTLYAKGERGAGFPNPSHRVTTDSPLWDWSEVTSWLFERGQVKEYEVVRATVVRATNRSLDLERQVHAAKG